MFSSVGSMASLFLYQCKHMPLLLFLLLIYPYESLQQQHYFSSTNQQDPLLVSTRYGPVLGVYDPSLLRGSNYSMPRGFLGIPFAHPPLGNLRFSSPVAWNQTWEEAYDRTTLNASHFSSECRQSLEGDNQDEDCLYLNIFTPSIERIREWKRQHGPQGMPVMLWIAGGMFEFSGAGSGDLNQFNLYDPADITSMKGLMMENAHPCNDFIGEKGGGLV